jgi:hydrogenase expression/formation protein HypD
MTLKTDRYRDKNVIRALLRRIDERRRALGRSFRIMEVCGTHTMAIHRSGLQPMLLDAGIEMISGPGCPVCITPAEFHEAAIALLAGREDLILATFGDMTRVPTRLGSLQSAAPAAGSAMEVIYSPDEALALAKRYPGKEVAFFGVGFETTIPAIALAAKTAHDRKLKNFSILSALWVIPPPLRAILDAGEVRISGFLYPGHVSAIIGETPYAFIARDYGIPGAIAGFEPADILLGLIAILDQIGSGTPAVANEYTRAVRPEGNEVALRLMASLLRPIDACWRGLGIIPASGLALRSEYASQNAEVKFGLKVEPKASDLPGCRCGEVLRGILVPEKCPLFGKACGPESPQGPCMVSFEGACLVHYRFRNKP